MMNEGNILLELTSYGEQGLKPEYNPQSIDGNTLNNKSVSVEKLDDTIIKYSNNLFNKNNLIFDKYINYLDGTLINGNPNDKWWTTDYIPIEPQTSYSVTAIREKAYYNEYKGYISGESQPWGTNMTFTSPTGAKYIRFSWANASSYVDINTLMMNKGNQLLPYEPYCIINEDLFPIEKSDISISLPDKIYAVVGDTLQIYYRSIIRANNVYDKNILLNCGIGKQLPRYFECTPSSVIGNVNFKVNIRDNKLNIISSKSCVLDIVSAGVSPSTNKNILCIGDSLTAAGYWVRELSRRLTESGGSPIGRELNNISFVGSMGYGNAKYYANGGWTWSDYVTQGRTGYRFFVSNVSVVSHSSTYTNNGSSFGVIEVNVTEGTGYILCEKHWLDPNEPEASGILTLSVGTSGDDATIEYSRYETTPANPFWNNGALTFVPYANEHCNGSIDAIYVLLGGNGLQPNKIDWDSTIALIHTFGDKLHSEFPNAKLKLMGCGPISFNGGAGNNEGASGQSYADQFGTFYAMLNYNEMCQTIANESSYSSFVEYVDVVSQIDCENNMPRIEVPVNTRNSATEWMDTNEMHPSMCGYYQIADVAYRNIIANFCQ